MNSIIAYCEQFPVISFLKNETIIQQEQSLNCVYILKKGLVESYNYTDEGCRRSICFNVPGDIIAEECAFLVSDLSLFYVRAYTDCELYKADKKDFIKAVFGKNILRNEIMKTNIINSISAKLQLDALGNTSGYKKILYILRLFCVEYGEDIEEHLVSIQIPLTHQEIADFCGLSRETTTILINKLKRKKIIKAIHSKHYEIRTNLLNTELNDEYNSGFCVQRM